MSNIKTINNPITYADDVVYRNDMAKAKKAIPKSELEEIRKDKEASQKVRVQWFITKSLLEEFLAYFPKPQKGRPKKDEVQPSDIIERMIRQWLEDKKR